MGTLEGRIAVVTGRTAGLGRGIASELAHCGARVFVTGRSIQDGEREDSRITEIRCDHREDEQVAAAFARAAQGDENVEQRIYPYNDGYVRANFRRALRNTPSIPAGT